MTADRTSIKFQRFPSPPLTGDLDELEAEALLEWVGVRVVVDVNKDSVPGGGFVDC